MEAEAEVGAEAEVAAEAAEVAAAEVAETVVPRRRWCRRRGS